MPKFSEITQTDIWSKRVMFIRGDGRTLFSWILFQSFSKVHFVQRILEWLAGINVSDWYRSKSALISQVSMAPKCSYIVRIYSAWITISQQLAYCIQTNRMEVSWENKTVSTTAVTCSTKWWHSMAVGYVEALLITIHFIITLLLYSNIFCALLVCLYCRILGGKMKQYLAQNNNLFDFNESIDVKPALYL